MSKKYKCIKERVITKKGAVYEGDIVEFGDDEVVMVHWFEEIKEEAKMPKVSKIEESKKEKVSKIKIM